MSFSSLPFHHVNFAKVTSNEKLTNFTASLTVQQRIGLPTLLAAGAKARSMVYEQKKTTTILERAPLGEEQILDHKDLHAPMCLRPPHFSTGVKIILNG